MTEFLDLPVEILPLILAYVLKPDHLASTARVSKTWNVFASPRLYERVAIFSWHRDSKTKVLMLFSTLAGCPSLAKHVRRLEIRDFPKAIFLCETPSGRTCTIPELVCSGLKNCSGLNSCVWTRDGSLSSEILDTLASIEDLQSLEFNGHNQGQYDPKLLTLFKSLQEVVAIMPSTAVMQSIHGLAAGESGHKLRSLTVICKSSPVVNDDVLKEIAPCLTNLEQFYVTGCPKVTERGVSAIVSSTEVGLRALSLESVSQNFDMWIFADYCADTKALRHLRSITLAVSMRNLISFQLPPPHTTRPWAQARRRSHLGDGASAVREPGYS